MSILRGQLTLGRTIAREIKADTQEILGDTTEIQVNTELSLAEFARLQQKLFRDVERHHTSGCMLERYLDNLTSYVETVYNTILTSVDAPRGSENGPIKQQEGTSSIYHSEATVVNTTTTLSVFVNFDYGVRRARYSLW
jgi:hypothetical protein